MNNIKIPYIVDTDGKPSMSASLIVVFGAAALTLNILKACGKVGDVANINELFFSSLALYFSRRNLMFGNKQFSAKEESKAE